MWAAGARIASAQSAPDGGAPSVDASAPHRAQVEIAAEASAYTGPPPYINVNLPRVTAGLVAPAVQRTVTRQKDPIVDCYKRLLAVSPNAQGRLEVHFEVIAGGSGLIDRVHFTPHRNASFEGCVRSALGNFTWSNPRGVPSTTVDLAIDLAPTPPAARPRGR
jgi:hypothetical protein